MKRGRYFSNIEPSKEEISYLEEISSDGSSSFKPNDCVANSNLDLVFWFAATGQDTEIPPASLIDVIIALSGEHFPATLGLGSRLLAEFGSIGSVLAADPHRFQRWFEQEGFPDWLIDQLHTRLKATAKLMQYALAEKIHERPIITSWQALLDYLKLIIGHNAIEQFRVLFLDKKNMLIKDEVQQRGTVDHTPLYPREIAKRSLELGASALILVHNHPSGDPTPSRADIEMTKQVAAALAPLRILLHDHLIIGQRRHTSFKSEGFL